MTIEDIIKNLRHCAASEGCGKDCQLYKEYGCYFKLMYAAADALEAADKLNAELLKNIEHWKSDVVKLRAQIPKEGEWIDIDGTMFAECSVCGKRHYGCTTPYCDMCGAKMKGEDDADN